MSPLTVDEAAFTPTKGKRHGRQRGAWVYLDAALLERVGVPVGAEFEVMRYALVERVRRRDGSERLRGRIVLNVRLLGQQERPFNPQYIPLLTEIGGLCAAELDAVEERKPEAEAR